MVITGVGEAVAIQGAAFAEFHPTGIGAVGVAAQIRLMDDHSIEVAGCEMNPAGVGSVGMGLGAKAAGIWQDIAAQLTGAMVGDVELAKVRADAQRAPAQAAKACEQRAGCARIGIEDCHDVGSGAGIGRCEIHPLAQIIPARGTDLS